MEKILEGCMYSSNVCVDCFELNHEKKFGCMSYDPNDDTVFIMEFDSVENLAEEYGTSVETWLGIDKIEIGKSIIDGAGRIYTRIW